MSITESILDDAALEWFGELGYAVGPVRHLVPGEPATELYSFGDVVLVGRLREAIWRLNPSISPRGLATLRGKLLTELLSGELSVSSLL